MLSEYGIRSLSNKDQFFRFGSDYYRGNIFVWQNYLVLRGLRLYYFDNAKAVQVYNLIRDRIIQTV